jgi:hypothetical protein
MSVSRLYVCVIERGGGSLSLERDVLYVVWVGGRERVRRVWVYPFLELLAS